MVDIEAKKKEIADTHAAAQEAMQKMFEALDAFDKIQIIEARTTIRSRNKSSMNCAQVSSTARSGL